MLLKVLTEQNELHHCISLLCRAQPSGPWTNNYGYACSRHGVSVSHEPQCWIKAHRSDLPFNFHQSYLGLDESKPESSNNSMDSMDQLTLADLAMDQYLYIPFLVGYSHP